MRVLGNWKTSCANERYYVSYSLYVNEPMGMAVFWGL